jgi:4a-hydroxytetrahydrobiopterin dehydratase
MTETATNDRITARQFQESSGVEDWAVAGDGATACFRTPSLAAGAGFVAAIGELGGIDEHRPSIDLRPDGVTVRLMTQGSDRQYGLGHRDVALARAISAIADRLDLPVDRSVAQNVQVTIDVLVRADVMPFWRAVLDYVGPPGRADELHDPRGRGPIFYFQQMAQPRPQRNRVHIDIWVPEDLAEQRVRAAVAAGGRVASDAHAPAWWILADAEGNEACVASRGQHLDF